MNISAGFYQNLMTKTKTAIGKTIFAPISFDSAAVEVQPPHLPSLSRSCLLFAIWLNALSSRDGTNHGLPPSIKCQRGNNNNCNKS